MSGVAQSLLASFSTFTPNGGAGFVQTATGSTITLAADGSYTGFGGGNWYRPTTAAIGAGYWYRTTRQSGSGGTAFTPGDGTWRSLVAGSAISMSGAGICSGIIEFATDSGGVNNVGACPLFINNAL